MVVLAPAAKLSFKGAITDNWQDKKLIVGRTLLVDLWRRGCRSVLSLGDGASMELAASCCLLLVSVLVGACACVMLGVGACYLRPALDAPISIGLLTVGKGDG